MANLLIIDDDEDFAGAAALDVMFPEDSSAGFELARAMRHFTEKLKNIPILMLTAVNAKFSLGFGSRDIDENWLPVSEFLEKPVDFDILKNKVAELLDKAGISESPSTSSGL